MLSTVRICWNFLRRAQCLIALGIFIYAYLTPAPALPGDTSDKIMHAVGCLLMYCSARFAFVSDAARNWVYIGVLGFALCAEFCHRWIPNRMFDPGDMMANFIGITLGFILFETLLLVVHRAQRLF